MENDVEILRYVSGSSRMKEFAEKRMNHPEQDLYLEV